MPTRFDIDANPKAIRFVLRAQFDLVTQVLRCVVSLYLKS